MKFPSHAMALQWYNDHMRSLCEWYPHLGKIIDIDWLILQHKQCQGLVETCNKTRIQDKTYLQFNLQLARVNYAIDCRNLSLRRCHCKDYCMGFLKLQRCQLIQTQLTNCIWIVMHVINSVQLPAQDVNCILNSNTIWFICSPHNLVSWCIVPYRHVF